jgi:parvulin-like peptidyl-prolyl isomerase
MKARFLASMLLVAALATACGGGGTTTPTADDVATVGPLHITKKRFDDQLAVARVNLKAQGQKFPKAGTSEYEALKANAMALLVMSAARELKAQEDGVEVTDEQVSTRLNDIKKQYFGGSEKKYQAQVTKQGLTDAEVRAQIKMQLISEKVAEQINADIAVSDDDVHEYYVGHKSEYGPERELQYILVGKSKDQTAADLRAQGQDPKKDKAAAAKVAAAPEDPKALAEQIYRELQNGAAFAALAKKYSQDASTKNTGGKLTAKKDQVVPKFGEVAFGLKTGELAKPFETPEYGWFVVKALKPVKAAAEKDVAETIREQLKQEQSNEAMTAWLSDATESVCTGKKVSYQVGYTPNPDPCAQFATSTTATDTGP